MIAIRIPYRKAHLIAHDFRFVPLVGNGDPPPVRNRFIHVGVMEIQASVFESIGSRHLCKVLVCVKYLNLPSSRIENRLDKENIAGASFQNSINQTSFQKITAL